MVQEALGHADPQDHDGVYANQAGASERSRREVGLLAMSQAIGLKVGGRGRHHYGYLKPKRGPSAVISERKRQLLYKSPRSARLRFAPTYFDELALIERAILYTEFLLQLREEEEDD